MRKQWKSRAAAGVSYGLALCLLAGCTFGGSSGAMEEQDPVPAGRPFEGIAIEWVTANHPWTEAIRELLPEFERETGMTVQVEGYFEDQLTQKLTVQFTSNAAAPDVFMHRPLQDGQLFHKNGWTEPLNEYVKDREYDFADFSPSAVRSATIDGSLVAVPVISEQEILYYRRDLLEQVGLAVPGTLEELQQAAQRLHDPGRDMYGFAARGQRSPLVTQVSSFLYSEGGDFITEGRASINTPEALSGMMIYGSLLREYGPPGVLTMSWPQATSVFAQGRAAFLTDASSLYRNVTDPAKSRVTDKVGFALFPAGQAGRRPYNITSWSLAMNTQSAHKEAAWAFIRWATSQDIVLKTQQRGNPGARASVWEKEEGTRAFPPELVPIMKESSRLGVDHDRPTLIRVAEARNVIGEVVQKIITGETNVKPAADEANKALQAVIDKDQLR